MYVLGSCNELQAHSRNCRAVSTEDVVQQSSPKRTGANLRLAAPVHIVVHVAQLMPHTDTARRISSGYPVCLGIQRHALQHRAVCEALWSKFLVHAVMTEPHTKSSRMSTVSCRLQQVATVTQSGT